MFEQWGGADLDALSSTLTPLCDEPDLTEEEYLAEVERQIALDPDNRPGPSAAVVIARGESEPITPALYAELDRIDVSTLDEDQAVGYAVAMDRVANAAHARRALGVARVVTVSPDRLDLDIPREQHATAQLAPALGVGYAAAADLV